jgi:hypothetical protein
MASERVNTERARTKIKKRERNLIVMINNQHFNNLSVLKQISDQELLNELKRRGKVKELKKSNGEIESCFIWKRDILNTNQEHNHENNKELAGKQNNNHTKSEYNLMGQVLGIYENQPKNLLGFEEKNIFGSSCLFTFLKTYPEYYQDLNFNEREKERITLIFDAKRFNNNLEPIKEIIKAGRVIKVFGRLNNNIHPKTGGRSFSVYSFVAMPENIYVTQEVIRKC